MCSFCTKDGSRVHYWDPATFAGPSLKTSLIMAHNTCKITDSSQGRRDDLER